MLGLLNCGKNYAGILDKSLKSHSELRRNQTANDVQIYKPDLYDRTQPM